MTETPRPVSGAHLRYVAEHTAPEDDFLRALKKAAAEAGIPSIGISPEQASFMQIVLKLRGAKDVVEVGTLGGYSAIAMARALPPDGRVRTLEIEPKHAAFAEEWIAKSDVAGRIEVICGDARKTMPSLETASADAIFLDADKPSYAADNAFAFGHLFEEGKREPEVLAIRAFNDLVAASPDLHGIIVPVGDGCWLAVKR
ncbi:MAG: O-methyltransferase [Planctomycetota bacterium]|jgi:predicted O-methyltransferase YrrM